MSLAEKLRQQALTYGIHPILQLQMKLDLQEILAATVVQMVLLSASDIMALYGRLPVMMSHGQEVASPHITMEK